MFESDSPTSTITLGGTLIVIDVNALDILYSRLCNILIPTLLD